MLNEIKTKHRSDERQRACAVCAFARPRTPGRRGFSDCRARARRCAAADAQSHRIRLAHWTRFAIFLEHNPRVIGTLAPESIRAILLPVIHARQADVDGTDIGDDLPYTYELATALQSALPSFPRASIARELRALGRAMAWPFVAIWNAARALVFAIVFCFKAFGRGLRALWYGVVMLARWILWPFVALTRLPGFIFRMIVRLSIAFARAIALALTASMRATASCFRFATRGTLAFGRAIGRQIVALGAAIWKRLLRSRRCNPNRVLRTRRRNPQRIFRTPRRNPQRIFRARRSDTTRRHCLRPRRYTSPGDMRRIDRALRGGDFAPFSSPPQPVCARP